MTDEPRTEVAGPPLPGGQFLVGPPEPPDVPADENDDEDNERAD